MSMWHDLLVQTYGESRVINVLAESSDNLQHATQTYDFGLFVVSRSRALAMCGRA